MKRIAGVVLSAVALTGCTEDSLHLYRLPTEAPVVHADGAAIAVARGAAVAVQPTMIRREVEGSTALDVTGMSSDDPAIVRVFETSSAYTIDDSPSRNGRTWVLVAGETGSAKVRFFRDDEQVSVAVVRVVEE